MKSWLRRKLGLGIFWKWKHPRLGKIVDFMSKPLCWFGSHDWDLMYNGPGASGVACMRCVAEQHGWVKDGVSGSHYTYHPVEAVWRRLLKRNGS